MPFRNVQTKTRRVGVYFPLHPQDGAGGGGQHPPPPDPNDGRDRPPPPKYVGYAESEETVRAARALQGSPSAAASSPSACWWWAAGVGGGSETPGRRVGNQDGDQCCQQDIPGHFWKTGIDRLNGCCSTRSGTGRRRRDGSSNR